MCSIANCNSTHKDRVSLFTFPKNAKLRATWNRQIKSTRADWHSPSEYSCVCSKHFTEDCFESQSVVSGIAFSLMFGCDFIIYECFRATWITKKAAAELSQEQYQLFSQSLLHPVTPASDPKGGQLLFKRESIQGYAYSVLSSCMKIYNRLYQIPPPIPPHLYTEDDIKS